MLVVGVGPKLNEEVAGLKLFPKRVVFWLVFPNVFVLPKALPVLVGVVPKGEPKVLVGLAPNKDVPAFVVAGCPNEKGVLAAPNAGLLCEKSPVF